MNRIGAVVSVRWVAETLRTSPKNVKVLDGTWHLPNLKRNARADFAREHIPGASFFDIDMCADQDSKHLSHMLPKPEEFELYVGSIGINNDTHVIVYDNHDRLPLFSAQRVWWTFRMFGHESVSVMEGGLRKWKAENNWVTEATPKPPRETFKAKLHPNLVKSFEEIERNIQDAGFTLLDARSSERFLGTGREPRPEIKAGKIPGSLNLPFAELLDEEKQTLKSREELLEIFSRVPVDLSKPLAASCGSGISACMIALAAYVCGKEDVSIYDGAWTEWYQRASPDQKENVPKY